MDNYTNGQNNGHDSGNIISFPKGFLWGAATSHFQVEGHPYEISTRCSDWSDWMHCDGRIADRTNADQACEFYTRSLDDLELVRELNLNAFRLSINWPTICPEMSGTASDFLAVQTEVERYRQLLIHMKERGLKTFVTLFHFCLPSWLAQRGGWHEAITVSEFARFASFMAKQYRGLVDYWITINEPLAYAYQGYIAGDWPPGLQANYPAAFECIRNMLKGHALAYKAIHEQDPNAQVSFTMHWRPFVARNELSPTDQLVRYYRDKVFNHVFPNAIQTGNLEFPFPLNFKELAKKISGPIPGIKDSMDFIGINYYTRDLCEFKYEWPIDVFGVKSSKPERAVDAMGWESYPDGLYKTLTDSIIPYTYDSKGHKRPIFITENGYADVFPADMIEGDWSLDDEQRIKYLHSHLVAVHKAIQAGANVCGYLHWSLMDNFEWAEGLRIRFGLVRIAFPTQERKFRKSAHFYSDIARHNRLPLENNGRAKS